MLSKVLAIDNRPNAITLATTMINVIQNTGTKRNRKNKRTASLQQGNIKLGFTSQTAAGVRDFYGLRTHINIR